MITFSPQSSSSQIGSCTGIGYTGSLIRFSDITDGASNTYLIGRKNLNADWYLTGESGGDNEHEMMGDNADIARWSELSNTPGNELSAAARHAGL